MSPRPRTGDAPPMREDDVVRLAGKVCRAEEFAETGTEPDPLTLPSAKHVVMARFMADEGVCLLGDR